MQIDLTIVIAYFVVMIGCGVVGVFLAKNTDDFMVAGRTLRYWMYFPCLSTVIIGGGATFGSASLSYEYGISGAWIVVMFGLGIITMGLLLSSKLANLRVISISEMLEVRYSASARYISAIISVMYATMLAVVQVIAIGTLLHAFVGWEMRDAMLIGGSICLLYTLLGGMWAVTITDLVQFGLIIVGVFCFLVPACLTKVGGFEGMMAAVPSSFFNPVAIGWHRLIMYFLLMYLGIMIGQDIWQRIFTARDTKVARLGTISAGLFSIVWGGAMAICGITASILYPELKHPQMALASVVVGIMPVGLLGLVISALLSALMSASSGQTLAAATLLVNDLIKPFAKNMSDKSELRISRLVTAILGACVLFLALSIQNVLHALDIAYALLSGCVFIPVMGGFFWRNATAGGALCSMFASFIATLICINVFGPAEFATITTGLTVSAVGLVVGSYLFPKKDEAKLAYWDKMLHASGNEKQL